MSVKPALRRFKAKVFPARPRNLNSAFEREVRIVKVARRSAPKVAETLQLKVSSPYQSLQSQLQAERIAAPELREDRLSHMPVHSATAP
ncbi:hypothetical protein AUJ65_06120 [Candidatus Micrarchaeota archaeon CG1_02_51_15]|nr:MAG: hypothetical protein AUJ65_06120 [Candidatus Micrarchaeota archaeon CG1_02_51_15]